jgi:hypothetical protein
MGRTAPRGAKRAPLTAKPAPSAASSKEAPGYLSSSTTGTMLDDLQLLEDAREISHAYFLAMLDWMAHSASLKQRDAISKASTLVRDDPTAENLAKATEIFYELALEAQLLGKLYPELGNEPAFLRVLAKMTVQAYLDSLAGKDYFGDADEPPTSVNSAGTDVGSQPSEQPCSCSNCRGRQKLSSEDLEGTFCAADLPQAALGEIEVAEAYNRQFDRPARKPTPSVRKKLLEKARRRRAEYDTPTSMESTMNFVGLRKPFSSTPLHELNPSESRMRSFPGSRCMY